MSGAENPDGGVAHGTAGDDAPCVPLRARMVIPMPGHDIIVVGASAGGVEALTALARDLPADLPAAVFLVLHLPTDATSALPQILNRRDGRRAAHARDGEAIEHGRIYVAPPDTHLLVKRGCVRVTRGPRENGHRPAVDPLFRTAAHAYGERVVGVVLSGSLDDGTAGLAAIKQCGGTAIVQDPKDALYSGMPRSAIENVAIDHVLPLAEIAPLLVRLAGEPVEDAEPPSVSRELQEEVDMAELETEALQNEYIPGSLSGQTCPECHGALWQLQDGKLLRFRCRVGHAYSGDSLLAAQSGALDTALWTALRALEETAELRRRLARRIQERGHATVAARFERQADEAQRSVLVIRQVLLNGELTSAVEPEYVEHQAEHRKGRGGAKSSGT